MSNIIQIKHGAAAPGKGILQPYELGYATNDGILYIGKEDGSATSVGIKTPVPITDGGTNATTAAKARENLGVNTQAEILEKVYPVGAIYISTVATNPATLFGFGSWEAISDRFLIGQSSTHAAGSTGGATEQTVSLPNHTHSMSSHTHVMAHTHNLNDHTHNMSSHFHTVTAKGSVNSTTLDLDQIPIHTHGQNYDYNNKVYPNVSGSNELWDSVSNGYYAYAPMTNDTTNAPKKGYSGAYHTSGGLWGVSDNEDTQYRVHTSQSGGGGSHNHGFTGSLAETSKNNNPTGGPSKKNTGDSTKNKTDPPNTNTTGNPNAEAIMEVPTMPPYLSVYMWKRTA